MADMWHKMLRDAERLDDAELNRHAQVSLRNYHYCRSCFTCACVSEQRRRALRRRGIDPDTGQLTR